MIYLILLAMVVTPFSGANVDPMEVLVVGSVTTVLAAFFMTRNAACLMHLVVLGMLGLTTFAVIPPVAAGVEDGEMMLEVGRWLFGFSAVVATAHSAFIGILGIGPTRQLHSASEWDIKKQSDAKLAEMDRNVGERKARRNR